VLFPRGTNRAVGIPAAADHHHRSFTFRHVLG
jgi:hypothetical protein